MDNLESVDRAITLLNEALDLDGYAMGKLIGHRVPCNAALADHPTIQVLKVSGEPYHVKNFDTGEVARHEPVSYSVGLLGVLNGIFGTISGGEHDGYGYITGVFDDAGQIIKFVRTDVL